MFDLLPVYETLQMASSLDVVQMTVVQLMYKDQFYRFFIYEFASSLPYWPIYKF